MQCIFKSLLFEPLKWAIVKYNVYRMRYFFDTNSRYLFWETVIVIILRENATGKGPELILSHEKRKILSNLLKTKWCEGRWGYWQITQCFLRSQIRKTTVLSLCTFPLERTVISA